MVLECLEVFFLFVHDIILFFFIIGGGNNDVWFATPICPWANLTLLSLEEKDVD